MIIHLWAWLNLHHWVLWMLCLYCIAMTLFLAMLWQDVRGAIPMPDDEDSELDHDC